jgi:protein PhnA
MQLPACPKCNCEYTYEDGEMLICPECAYEWSQNSASTAENATVIKDAHGTVLADGDTVVVIKDLKLKGSSAVIKGGTKVKNIRLNFESDHNLDCKVEGIGAMGLKSEFVKKA